LISSLPQSFLALAPSLGCDHCPLIIAYLSVSFRRRDREPGGSPHNALGNPGVRQVKLFWLDTRPCCGISYNIPCLGVSTNTGLTSHQTNSLHFQIALLFESYFLIGSPIKKRALLLPFMTNLLLYQMTGFQIFGDIYWAQ
jgi:hypothetical protein